VPSGAVAGVTTWLAYSFTRDTPGVSLDQARTVATCVLVGLGIYVLSMLCRPLNPYRMVLLALMVAGFAVALFWDPVSAFFALELPESGARWPVFASVVAGVVALELGPRLVPWWRAPARTTTREEPPARSEPLPD